MKLASSVNSHLTKLPNATYLAFDCFVCVCYISCSHTLNQTSFVSMQHSTALLILRPSSSCECTACGIVFVQGKIHCIYSVARDTAASCSYIIWPAVFTTPDELFGPSHYWPLWPPPLNGCSLPELLLPSQYNAILITGEFRNDSVGLISYNHNNACCD